MYGRVHRDDEIVITKAPLNGWDCVMAFVSGGGGGGPGSVNTTGTGRGM